MGQQVNDAGDTIAADYVIVGAGSAGCVLANRLSADGARVVLIEAGPPDTSPLIHIPAGALKLHRHPVLNWNFFAEPEEGTGGRALHWPRGKVLGGSSSINGMLYVRGNARDYDRWAQMGCSGWSYDDVLPYFKKSESYAVGADKYHGGDGPMAVEQYRTVLPLTDRFVAAAVDSGIPLNPDYNGATQEGVSYSQNSRKKRFRASTAQAFLVPAKSRSNLRVVTNALAQRLTFSGKRCTGVVVRQGEKDILITAAREVIVSAGAIGSPHLLQISGVGDGDHLRSIGVDVVHDIARRRRQPVRPLLRDGRASHPGHHLGQHAGARAAAGRRSDQVRIYWPRRAHLRRHHRDGVHAHARRARKPGPAALLHADVARSDHARIRQARAGPGRIDCRLCGAAGEPRHDPREIR